MSDAEARITTAIAESIRAGELGEDTAGMPAQWVLAGIYYDSDGDLCTALLSNEGARTHETLGLLALAQATYTAEAVRWAQGDED